MIKQAKSSYRGMNQDLSNSKRGPDYYYEANDIRIVSTTENSTGSATNELGNTVKLSLAEGQVIIGTASINQYIVLLSTDDAGIDKITRVDVTDYSTFELYSGDLNFSSDNLISTETYYDTDDIQKVYWVDGVNQLRHVNIIVDTPYTQSDTTLFDIVPTVEFCAPKVTTTSFGGTHTAGVIQYAYSLIDEGGSQSAISPMSPLYPLNKEKGGGEVNEVVGKINHVNISHIDPKYDIIRVYAIKYTGYNQSPIISLINEQYIEEATSLTILDDGRVTQTISQEEFLFLGGTPIIPETISSKYNRLILGNIKEDYFDITTEQFDTRSFRFPEGSSEAKIRENNNEYETVAWDTTTQKYRILDGTFSDIPTTHDCINDSFLEEASINQRTKSSLKYIITSTEALGASLYTNVLSLSELPHNYEYIDVVYTSPIAEAPSKTFSFQYDSSIYFPIQLLNVLNNEFNNSDYTTKAVEVDILALTGIRGANPTIGISTTNNTTGNSIDLEVQVKIYNYTESTATSTTIDLYQSNNSTYGSSGTNIDLSLTRESNTNPRNILKAGEVYRLGIEFYNDKGQTTPPKWICDLKCPEDSNLGSDDILQLNVTIKNIDVLSLLGAKGWNILRVDRTPEDKTVIAQGIVNGTMFQDYRNEGVVINGNTVDLRDDRGDNYEYGIPLADDFNIKLPSAFMRTADYNTPQMLLNFPKGTPEADEPIFDGKYIKINQLSHGRPLFGPPVVKESSGGFLGIGRDTIRDPRYEIYRYTIGGDGKKYIRHNSYEETRLFNFYSPEITFLDTPIEESTYFKSKVLVETSIENCSAWGIQYEIDTQFVNNQAKKDGVIGLVNASTTDYDGFNQHSLIGGTGNEDVHNKYQYYKKYDFNTYCSGSKRDIIGTPLEVGTGEHNLVYEAATDGGTKYRFNNSLFSVISDVNVRDDGGNFLDFSDRDYKVDKGIISVNSMGHICLGIIEKDETPLETILEEDAPGHWSGAKSGVIELRRVLANQYGGNTYEARSRNTYLRIGNYTSIRELNNATSYTYEVYEPGDTFVYNYRFARIIANPSQVIDPTFYTMTEIIEFPVETSIDLANRNDASVYGWDSLFQPTFSEYHDYNRVYSQQPIFNSTTANIFTFKARKTFSNRINATKVKVSGELIDAWTDVLVNEEMYLDGKYGKLFKLIRNNDYMYAFQERAISILSIQPRIQTQGSDGVGVELGIGAVLYDKTYITTESGCANPLCVFNSPYAVYYLDLGNKSINRLVGNEIQGLSDMHGFHSYLQNNLEYDSFKYSDNIHGVFDPINNDAYFTKKSIDGSSEFTLVFNEFSNSFSSFYSFIPTRYLVSNYGLYSSPNNNSLWEHFTGEYGSYYGEDPVTSTITLMVNPEPNGDCIFDNLEYKSQVYELDGSSWVDSNTTLNTIRAHNDYQDSGTVTLVNRVNIRRRFRNWSMFIPRDTITKRARIRNSWTFITLGFDNADNRKLILHDIYVSYDAVEG